MICLSYINIITDLLMTLIINISVSLNSQHQPRLGCSGVILFMKGIFPRIKVNLETRISKIQKLQAGAHLHLKIHIQKQCILSSTQIGSFTAWYKINDLYGILSSNFDTFWGHLKLILHLLK